MKQRLIHPLWVHIPAPAVLIGTLGYLLLSGWDDHKDALGYIAVFGVLGVLYVSISILADELWARQEKCKVFNWFSLLDEAAVGLITAPFFGRTVWVIVGCAVFATVIFELMRPYRPYEQHVIPEDTSVLEREIGMKTEHGEAWVYSDIQNPGWLNRVLIISVFVLAVGAISTFNRSPWNAMSMLLIAFLLVALYGGGMQTSVTPARAEVRFGVIGIRTLRLRIIDIESTEVHTFSPLAELVSMNLKMKACFLQGNRGMLLTTNQGKKYLIGSDHPERLASVIQIAMRYAG